MTKHLVIENQTIFDIALKYYGNIDGVFDIIKKNENLNLSLLLNIGDNIIYKQDDTNDFAKYYEKHKIETATGFNDIISIPGAFSLGFSIGFNS